MTKASLSAAGYAILTEDDSNEKYTSVRKSYAPIAYEYKTFTPSQIKLSIYAKENGSSCTLDRSTHGRAPVQNYLVNCSQCFLYFSYQVYCFSFFSVVVLNAVFNLPMYFLASSFEVFVPEKCTWVNSARDSI